MHNDIDFLSNIITEDPHDVIMPSVRTILENTLPDLNIINDYLKNLPKGNRIQIVNNITPTHETWHDPGDYPSGAGGGPLSSRRQVTNLEGEAIVKFKLPAAWAYQAEDGNVYLRYIIDNAEESGELEVALHESGFLDNLNAELRFDIEDIPNDTRTQISNIQAQPSGETILIILTTYLEIS